MPETTTSATPHRDALERARAERAAARAARTAHLGVEARVHPAARIPTAPLWVEVPNPWER
jgi:hypothetical protein